MSVCSFNKSDNTINKKVCFDLEELANFNSDEKKLKVLILADTKYPAEVVKDHVEAIVSHSRHEVCIKSPVKTRFSLLAPKVTLLDENNSIFDVVIIHYSLCILFDSYIPKYLREEIRLLKELRFRLFRRI